MGRDAAAVDQLLASLTDDERRALAALAVVGETTLAPELVAGLADVVEAERAVASLRAKGLVEEDEEGRTSALRSLAEHVRRTEAAISTGERLLRALTTLARADRLGRAELEAILSLTGWAADAGEWQGLLELVQTVESVWSFAEHADERLVLLERGVAAARALGDTAAEAQLLRALRGGPSGDAPSRDSPRPRSLRRMLVRTGALAAAGGIGLAAGIVLPGAEADPVSTVPVTATIGVTITGAGTTVVSQATLTDVQTVTTPPETVTVTVTQEPPAFE